MCQALKHTREQIYFYYYFYLLTKVDARRALIQNQFKDQKYNNVALLWTYYYKFAMYTSGQHYIDPYDFEWMLFLSASTCCLITIFILTWRCTDVSTPSALCFRDEHPRAIALLWAYLYRPLLIICSRGFITQVKTWWKWNPPGKSQELASPENKKRIGSYYN